MASKSLDGVLIKKAHVKQSFTEDQIHDIMMCSDMTDGPDYFMDHFFFIQHPTKGKLKYAPFPFQKGLIRSYNDHRFNINLLSRQTGKSTTAAGYLLWYAMFVPDSTILIAAHKYTGAQEIMQRIRYAYESCPDHIRAGVTNYNKGSIEFDNGSRIVSATTTGNTGRGMSISLLYCDEFAFVAPNIATEFWTSISPTLATGGKCIITSTPNSDEDQFALIWKEANKRFDDFGNEQPVGVNGFHPFIAKWNEHPERDEKWAAEEKGRIGEERFRREHECEFLIFDETLIDSITLAGMEGKDPIFRMGQIRWYKKINRENTYLIAWDPCLGTGGDYAALEVFELPGMKQVGEWHNNTTPIQAQARILREICEHIASEQGALGYNNPKCFYSIENNTLGEAGLISIAEIGEENIKGGFLSEPIRHGHVRKFRKGFNTTHKTKLAACAKLKQLIETGKIEINSKMLITQLKAYIAQGVTFGAKTGEHDDLVSAFLVIIRMLNVLSDWDPAVYKLLMEKEEQVMPLPFYMS
jgi:hypothetical protein